MMAWRDVWIVRWLHQHVSEPLVAVCHMGVEPKTLAMSGALGTTFGVFPFYGVTALMCAWAIAILGHRCNPPTMMLANLVTTPLKLTLLVPFLRLGEFVVGAKHFPLSIDSFWKVVTGKASWHVILGFCHAFLGWTIAAPLIIGGLYCLLLPMTRFSIQRYGHGSEQAEGHMTSPFMKDPSVCTV